MFQKLVIFCTTNRNRIIHLFQIGYVGGFVFLLFCGWVIFSGSALLRLVYEAGLWLGKISTLLFIVVTTPGILGRLGFKHPFITIGILFRRHTGISMFLTGLAHGLIVYAFPQLSIGKPIFPLMLFQTFGLLTLVVLFPLFLTSNLYSMQRLGKNWKRLHKLIYLAFWTMMLHIGLQGEKGLTLLVGIMALLEMISLIVDWKRQKQTVMPIPVSPTQTTQSTPNPQNQVVQ